MLEIRIAGLRAEAHPAENPRYRSRMLLIHGLWGSAAAWRSYASFLAHRGWETVAADLRARRGDDERAIEAVSFSDYRDDVLTLLDSEVIAASPEEDRAAPVVIGHDLGGLLALATADPERCSAIVALAPPVGAAVTDHYRRMLGRGGRWFRRRLRPPVGALEPGDDAGAPFHDESARVVRQILADETPLPPHSPPVLVIGGTHDRLVDPERLRQFAERRGYAYAERDAGHWGLGGPGFERQVDPMHRWLVKQVGPSLLRLSGYEDVDDEND